MSNVLSRRLPSYDKKTGQAELAVFSSLGLAAVGLIVNAVVAAMRFASEKECIVAALTGPQSGLVQMTGVTATNRGRIHAVSPCASGGNSASGGKLAAPQR